MAEYLLDDSPEMTQWVRPDEKGFTVRTQFKGTQEALDRNARIRSVTPTTFRDKDGGRLHHVGSIPAEVYNDLQWKLGRAPTTKELLALLDDRDYSKLKTRDVRLT